MSDKKDFSEFSIEEIANISAEAGKQAKEESLAAGIKPLYKDIETDQFYIIELDSGGKEQRKYLSKEEVEALTND